MTMTKAQFDDAIRWLHEHRPEASQHAAYREFVAQIEGEPEFPRLDVIIIAWHYYRTGFEHRRALPVPMILTCPSCSNRHVDIALAEKPHHTHACQSCGFVWRPALCATIGVQFLPGFKDEPSPSADGFTAKLRDRCRSLKLSALIMFLSSPDADEIDVLTKGIDGRPPDYMTIVIQTMAAEIDRRQRAA